MSTFVTIIHVVTCILLVLVVLVQSGKGAEISASFGGSSQTVFGSSGGANFFVKFTQGAAAIFFITSLALTILGGQSKKSLFETAPGAPVTQPAAPAPGAPAQNAPAQGAAPAQNAPTQGAAAPAQNTAPAASAQSK